MASGNFSRLCNVYQDETHLTGVHHVRTYPAGAVTSVRRWSLWEIALSNERGYSNPFADVTLQAVLTAPSGRRVTVSGSYDGGITWRVRFMPDERGV
ncbi:MAG: hypothetical protein C4335_13485 [Armatimonadota bacterium]